MVDQLNAFAVEVTRVAREVGTDGKLGGQAAGPRRRRHLEGPDRQRQLHGLQPHRPGPQHRRSDHRRRQRRPVQENHRRRPRRDPANSKKPSTRWSISSTRSPPKSPASPAKSAPKASSAARPQVPGVAGTWKDLTDNVNSMAANLTGQVRNIAEVTTAVATRRPLAQDHRRRQRRNPASSRTPSIRWSTSSTPSPPKSRASPAKSAPKASSAARRRCPAWPAPGRTSPTTSTPWPRNLTGQVRNIAEVDDRRRQRRPFPQDHRRRPRRNSAAERNHQHDGRAAPLLRCRSHSRGPRSRHRRPAGRCRPRCPAWPAPGRTSPTRSTPWPPTSPRRSATSPK